MLSSYTYICFHYIHTHNINACISLCKVFYLSESHLAILWTLSNIDSVYKFYPHPHIVMCIYYRLAQCIFYIVIPSKFISLNSTYTMPYDSFSGKQRQVYNMKINVINLHLHRTVLTSNKYVYCMDSDDDVHDDDIYQTLNIVCICHSI